MWYSVNRFRIMIHDCDGSAATLWRRHSERVEQTTEDRVVSMASLIYTGAPNFRNLMSSLKTEYHDGVALMTPPQNKHLGVHRSITTAFDMLKD